MNINFIKSLVAGGALIMSTSLTSCVGDLDVDPINPQQTMELDTDALLNKIYSCFCLTGQTGASGNGDLEDIDEGRSEAFRMSWNMNELTSDEAVWHWATDAGMSELMYHTYGASHPLAAGLYSRLYFSITLCNFYLQQVSGDDEETQHRIAEVRFIRALNYYYVMDLFGNGPFTEQVSSDLAEYYTSSQLFSFIESELKDIDNDLVAPGQNSYGRVDKVAAWNLLARIYLNAQVYTGTAQWQNAKDYAEKVINNGYYHLCTTGKTNPVTGEQYSAYQMLFLADNNTNGAQYEDIFPVLLDGVLTKSYGGTNFLVEASYANTGSMATDVPSGSDGSWGKCMAVKKDLLDKFYTTGNYPAGRSVAEMTSAANDDRALFYGYGFNAAIEDVSDNGGTGFGVVKFRNVRSDGQSAQAVEFVDTDLPLMRLAEAYLTYAEASTRISGANTDAKQKIDALRSRANANLRSSYTLDDICDEWAREFWFEGRRRTDLIRFDKFGGQSTYKWEWMGGTYEGAQFAKTRNIFALPENELASNTNLKQNPGY
jgi:hypothetical protein